MSAKRKILNKDLPGAAFEKAVARIQQKIDPNSVVTHNEVLRDRVGNDRQCDVVIRGQFGGQVLGIMECKDHNTKLGPGVIEAFAKKSEHLGANLRIMISKKGFTKSALKLAKHENIGCLSLLPKDPMQAGFSIGDMWYGEIQTWENIRLRVNFAVSPDPLVIFNPGTVKWGNKPICLWFLRELFTTHGDEQTEGIYLFTVRFSKEEKLEIDGQECYVTGVDCMATRVCQKKKKWINWSGDAFYDWQSEKCTIAPGGTLVGSAVNTNLTTWLDHEGEIPHISQDTGIGLMQGVLRLSQKWDKSQDVDVPDLDSIGTSSFLLKSTE